MLASKHGFSKKEVMKLNDFSYATLDQIEKKNQDSEGVEVENLLRG